MNAETAARPVSCRVFLFGDGDDSVASVAESVERTSVLQSLAGLLGPLASAAQHAVAHEFAWSVATLLDFDLLDLLAAGWRKHTAVVAAARRTAAAPGTEELVELAEHRIMSTQRPTVDLVVDDIRVGTVHLELSFEFLVKTMVGTIRGGRLVALHSGLCEASAHLSAEGIEMVTRQGHLDLGLTTTLGEGIALLPEAALGSTEPTVVLPES